MWCPLERCRRSHRSYYGHPHHISTKHAPFRGLQSDENCECLSIICIELCIVARGHNIAVSTSRGLRCSPGVRQSYRELARAGYRMSPEVTIIKSHFRVCPLGWTHGDGQGFGDGQRFGYGQGNGQGFGDGQRFGYGQGNGDTMVWWRTQKVWCRTRVALVGRTLRSNRGSPRVSYTLIKPE